MVEPAPTLIRTDRFADSSTLVAVIEALPHDVALLDTEGRVITTNGRWSESLDDPIVAWCPGDRVLEHLHAVSDRHRPIAEHVADGLARIIAGRSRRFELQYEIRQNDVPRWFLLAASVLPDGLTVVTHTDTTIHHSVQDVLAEMAFHDTLTGLPNRALVIDRIRMALIRAQRSDIVPAIFFIDLDGFKAVNDVHGHAIGDEVLVEASRRLTSSVRDGDTCGRWGGDEFVLVIELTDVDVIESLVSRTRQAFADPITVDGIEVEVGLSIGVVISRASDDVAELLRLADEAMYQAKRAGHNVRVVSTTRPDEGDAEILYLP